MRTTTLISALLYAAMLVGANPGFTQSIDASEREAILAMREGNMRKFRVYAEALPAASAGFFSESGEDLSFSDSDGMFRLVNFWATWCGPCREEMPTLDALQAEMGSDDFRVMAIATGRNKLGGLRKFNTDYSIENLPILLDPKSALGREKSVFGLPVTMLLDREGREIARLQGGADWADAHTWEVLSALMEAADS